MTKTNTKGNEYKLRLATYEDKDLLFEWANDPEVRNNSFSQDEITKETHDKWFSQVMENDNVIIYIMLKEDMPVGQCRLNITEGGVAEIGYSISKQNRGKGLGSVLIGLITEDIKRNKTNVNKLVGKVKPDNNPSINSFKKNNFIEEYHSFTYNLDRINSRKEK